VFLRHLIGDMCGTAKFLSRLDQVIGGHDHHHSLRVFTSNERGAQADAGGGIAAAWLADDSLGRKAWQLFSGFVAVSARGYDPGAFRRNEGLNSISSFLEQAAVAGELEKLLRAFDTAAWPESCATAAGHDESMEHRVFFPLKTQKPQSSLAAPPVYE